MRLKGFELAVCGIDLFRAIGGLYEAKTSLVNNPIKKRVILKTQPILLSNLYKLTN